MSPTNLIAALRLALDLWKREYQEKNTREIVKRGTALYEKLVSFTETFERIGETLRTTSNAYDTALNQLSAGKGNDPSGRDASPTGYYSQKKNLFTAVESGGKYGRSRIVPCTKTRMFTAGSMQEMQEKIQEIQKNELHQTLCKS